MSWLIVGELLFLQCLLVAFFATNVWLIPWRWLRWLVWTIVLLAFFLLGLVILADAPSESYVRGLTFWEQMLTPAGGAPTRRMFSISLGIACFAFPLGVTIVAMVRSFARLPKGRPAGWSLGRLAVSMGVAAALVVATVLLNDYLICRDLVRAEQSAKQKAVSLIGPAPPVNENAYVAIRRAGELAEQAQPIFEFRQEPPPPDKSRRWRRKDFRLSPAELERLRSYFQTHSEIHDLCARAAESEKYVPLIDDGQFWDMDKEADRLRTLARFLHIQGHFQLTAEQSAEAYVTATMMRRTAEHLSLDRRPIAVLLAFGFEGMASDLLERAINIRPPTAAEVRTLQRAGFEFRPALQRMVDWCEAEQLSQIASNYLKAKDSSPGLFLPRLLYARDDMSATPINYQFWRNVAADPYPIPDPEEVPTGIWPRGYARVGEGGGMMTMILLPAVFSLEDSTAHADTRRRLADYALDLTLNLPELSEARLKESLARVNAPLDPRDGSEVRARVRSGGVTLYGVGLDRNDDGGASEDFLEGDIIFYLGPEFTKIRLMTE